LPTVKSSEVSAAPTHTSPQAIRASGSSLKIRAKSTVITMSDSAALAACSRITGCEM
jgi:hypothetical protein